MAAAVVPVSNAKGIMCSESVTAPWLHKCSAAAQKKTSLIGPENNYTCISHPTLILIPQVTTPQKIRGRKQDT